MAVTIKDIARLSGYGIGTVSRVLNNHPDVSEKARSAILQVVEEQGFEPNSNAKHLKMQGRSAIAVLVKGSQNLLFADILERIQMRLSDNGEDIYTAYLDEDANEVLYAVQLCRLRRPKGIVFLGGDLEHFRKGFGEISVPCVLLTNNAGELGYQNLSSFTTDDRKAARAVIDYLVDCGHSHIGILGGNLSLEQISHLRLQGIEDGMYAHVLPFDREKQYRPCRFSMEAGYQGAKDLLTRNPDLTAIFALGDVIALGAMRAIRDMELHVPREISIVGYDDIVSAQYSIPRLTTVHQDAQALAQQGVDTLLKQLRTPAPPVHGVIPYTLCTRESVQKPQERLCQP